MDVWANSKDRAVRAEPEIEIGSAAETASQRRILVVNPDLQQRRTFKEKLRRGLHRCQTYGAASAEEALAMVERVEVDCVLLSEFVPDFRNLELIGHLTNCSSFKSIPAVVVFEASDSDSEKRAQEAGAAGFLHESSCSEEMLCSTITAAIAHDRLMRVIEIQNRQIQLLGEERSSYIQRTDDLAHELLTPLAAIQEFVSLVFDEVAGPVNEEQAKHLAYARGGCDRIRSTVESLIVNRDLEQILGTNS